MSHDQAKAQSPEQRKAYYALARKQLLQAAERARFCWETSKRMKGVLQEHVFAHAQEDARKLTGRTRKAKETQLDLDQSRRRFCYGGWRLAAATAFLELSYCLEDYQRSANDLQPGELSFIDAGSMPWIWVLNDVFEPPRLTINDTPVSTPYMEWREDETEGRALKALQEAYEQCLAGTFNVPVANRWDPFSDEDDHYNKAFTFIHLRWFTSMLSGSHLLQHFQKVREEHCPHAQLSGGHHFFEDVERLTKGLDGCVQRLMERQYRERRSEMEARKVHAQERRALDFEQGKKRGDVLEHWQKLKDRFDAMAALDHELKLFIATHHAQQAVMEELPKMERQVAMYNLVVAFIVRAQIAKHQKAFAAAADKKYLPIVTEIAPLVSGLPELLVENYQYQLKVLGWTLTHEASWGDHLKPDLVWGHMLDRRQK